ncbi:helix-turn-helix transcriptional regulator [Streptomyces sp. NBC_00091]|uniref:ArsR/SmtB family transcription factor n=1 Tax=Streptomyces sp. NBC_00091 TaxID=2975648 RepID=UPI0022519E3A|nr:winged helix-turn-helix domain-containing protein [Streptomyces sp. NBC_00091]MCX5378619.1 winged helix-turn-helix domain-containing protein [Streptomyces sp. NBC_00091]
MLLRIHFTGADLVRTSVAHRPDPLWETVLSLRVLQHRAGSPAAECWGRDVLARQAGNLRTLLPLVRPYGYFPDFLTPPDGALGIEHGIDALTATPARHLRGDLTVLAAGGTLPPWTRDLAAGRPDALRGLARALRGYYATALAPLEQSMRTTVRAEYAAQATVAAESGIEGVLSDLGPGMRWNPPVLEVRYSVNQELHLNGRGLLLVPTLFRARTPVSLLDPELPPVLTYPARRTVSPGAPAAGKLGPLMGRTRTAILQSTAETSRSTSELARLVGMSQASVSHHTTVLRAAGLISSTRHRNTVLHSVTSLGSLLLRG